MNNIESILETFTRFRFAEWAGDFVYARTLLKNISTTFIETIGENPSPHPLGVLGENIEILKHRLESLTVDKSEGSPYVFEDFNYVRGVVWRAGRNEFELRAYLNDFNWEEEFYRRVSVRNEITPESLNWPTKTDIIVKSGSELANGAQVVKGRGGNWILDGRNFFREVVVSDIGIFRVKGLWSKRRLPRTRMPILRGFQEVLADLEGNNGNAS